MHTAQYEDFVIVMALGQLSYQFRDAEPELSNTAWDLAVTIAGDYGITPSEAVRLLE